VIEPVDATNNPVLMVEPRRDEPFNVDNNIEPADIIEPL
jgi:hypothetical protein